MFSLWKNDIRRLREIAVLFSVALVLDFLIFVLSKDPALSYVGFFVIIILGIFIIPIVNYEYLHDRTKATHLASLPYTKTQVFVVKFCSGLFVLVLPILLYYVAICFVSNNYAMYTSIVLPVVLLVLFYYTIVCLVANLTATAWTHGGIAVFVTCMPYGLYIAINAIFTSFVRGVVFDVGLTSIIALIFPGFKLALACLQGGLQWQYTLLYSAYCFVAFVVALLISSKRPLENTGKGFAFAIVEKIMKVIIVVAFSWIITSVLVMDSNFESMIFSNIIITFVLSMLMQIKKGQGIKYKQGSIQTICICVVSLTMFIVSSNYLESYIPQNPQSVSIQINNEWYGDSEQTHVLTSNEKAMETVKRMHAFLLSNTGLTQDDDIRDFSIYYYLKNGDKVVRSYQVDQLAYEKLIDIMDDSDVLVKTHLKKYEEVVKNMKKVTEIQIGTDLGVILVNTESGIETFKKLIVQEIEKVQGNHALIKSFTTSEAYSLMLTMHDSKLVDGGVRDWEYSYYCTVFQGNPLERAIARYLGIKETNEEFNAN